MQQFQWTVLPQGIANSPIMCQYFVDGVRCPVHAQFQNIYIAHYMDNILLACSTNGELQCLYKYVITYL